MRCMVCDGEMMLLKGLPHDPRPVPDFEWRSFKCSACLGLERHLVFASAGREADAEPMPVHALSASGRAAGAAAVTDRDESAEQTCKTCRSPMLLVGTLPATTHFRMQRIFKCSGCKSVVADTAGS